MIVLECGIYLADKQRKLAGKQGSMQVRTANPQVGIIGIEMVIIKVPILA